MAVALHAAHEAGVVHRDIKPHNVMLVDITEGSRTASIPALLLGRDIIKIIDFGFASVAEERLSIAPIPNSRPSMVPERITQQGEIFGTIAYMAPKASLGMDAVDERSDLYALGIVLYLMLTGRHPFDETASEVGSGRESRAWCGGGNQADAAVETPSARLVHALAPQALRPGLRAPPLCPRPLGARDRGAPDATPRSSSGWGHQVARAGGRGQERQKAAGTGPWSGPRSAPPVLSTLYEFPKFFPRTRAARARSSRWVASGRWCSRRTRRGRCRLPHDGCPSTPKAASQRVASVWACSPSMPDTWA
jgi:serine/threonine protein kinase